MKVVPHHIPRSSFLAALAAGLPLLAQRHKVPGATPTSVGARSASELRGDAGLNAALATIYSDMTQEPNRDLKGIVVLRGGRLLSEHYFNGDSAETLHDIRSATKSITSLLMGIAIHKGIVRSINDSIALYLPGMPKDGKEKITIKDLLTMRSGLDADDDDPTSPGNESTLDQSSDWIRSVYAVPMKRTAGSSYLYCSMNAFLAGAIIENASRMSLDQFAKLNLFEALGIRTFNWRQVPIGRTTGQGNLSITTRDEATIGQLLLSGGTVNNRRILPQDWINQCLAKHVAIADSDPFADFYGYMWYSKALAIADRRVEVHFASGNGGNKIYIIPSDNMVVAITSSAYGRGYGQRRSQAILLRILAAAQSK